MAFPGRTGEGPQRLMGHLGFVEICGTIGGHMGTGWGIFPASGGHELMYKAGTLVFQGVKFRFQGIWGQKEWG